MLVGFARVRLAILAGAGCSGFSIAAGSVALRGTGGIRSDADWHARFDRVTEMLPVTGAAAALQDLLTGVLAALPLGWLALRHRRIMLSCVALCAIARRLLDRLDRGAVPGGPRQVAADPASGNILNRIMR
jgi:hypothetical protein